MNTTNSHKDLVKKYYDIFNNGNFEEYDNLLTKDIIEHNPDPNMQSDKKGLEYIREVNSTYNKAFPDGKFELQHILEDGDKVAVHWKAKGNNTGEFGGQQATNKNVEIEGFDMFCFDGDKISEHWGVFDSLGMLTQLGLTGNGESKSQGGNSSGGNI
jgi:steroid delta-isomerase-like uncharacterized protein